MQPPHTALPTLDPSALDAPAVADRGATANTAGLPNAPSPLAPAAARPTAVLLCNLGTPDAPTPSAVRRYLAEFLSDPRVVEIPRALWLPILWGVILPLRPRRSAAKYASIWTPEGSPLKTWTAKQATLLRGYLGERGHPVPVRYAMRYGNPSIASELNVLAASGAQRIVVLPAYPQYSATTTASIADAVYAWAGQQRNLPELRIVHRWGQNDLYIDALAQRIREHWQVNGRGELLVMSFHGIPARNVRLGDPYADECRQTAERLAERLQLKPEQYRLTFQSRFGRARWLEPYTEPTLIALARQGVKAVDVVCPGFVCDCLETLEEINQEARAAFLTAGGQRFEYIPCLNDSHGGMVALAEVAQQNL